MGFSCVFNGYRWISTSFSEFQWRSNGDRVLPSFSTECNDDVTRATPLILIEKKTKTFVQISVGLGGRGTCSLPRRFSFVSADGVFSAQLFGTSRRSIAINRVPSQSSRTPLGPSRPDQTRSNPIKPDQTRSNPIKLYVKAVELRKPQ